MKKSLFLVLTSALVLTGCSQASSVLSSQESSVKEIQNFKMTYEYSNCTLSAEGYSSLPEEVKDGTALYFTVTMASSYELSSFKVNGQVVKSSGGKYAVEITANTLVSLLTKAISSQPASNISNEFENSLEVPESYDIAQHTYHTENLPVISINTENGTPVDDESLQLGNNKGMHKDIMEYDYIGCTVDVTDCEGYEMSAVSGKVKIRGNYTSTYEKRPLRIKFDKKQNMCGLNGGKKFKNWVLLAEYTDGSLLKNSVTEYLGKTMLGSDGEYCTDYRFVQVYLNGSYNGLYNLVEQQEVKEDRVDLPEAKDPEDYSDADEETLKDTHIGYFLEYDGYYENEAALQTFAMNYASDQKDLYDNAVSYLQPGFTVKNDLFYQEQNDYIKGTMQAIWDIIYDATNKSHNPISEQPFYTLVDGQAVADTSIKTPREAIEKVIDVDSLLDMFFIEEIAEDSDLDWSSFYMTIDMSDTGDHKLHYCAPWDFDNGFSTTSAGSDIFYTMKCTGSAGSGVSHNNANPWLITFSNENWFWALAKDKWSAHVSAGTFSNVSQMITDYSIAFADAYTSNAERWPSVYSSSGVPAGGNNCSGGDDTNTVTPESKIAELKQWYENRITVLTTLLAAK